MVTDFSWYLEGAALLVSWAVALYFVNYMVRERRPAQSLTAWLLIMFFLPVVGVIAYAFFGWRKVHKRRHRAKSPIDFDSLNRPAPESANPTDALIRTYGVPGAFPGNRVELLTDRVEAYEALVELIEAAEEELWIDMYMLALDPVGAELVQRFAAAARRGVRVLLLIDDVGSMGAKEGFLEPLTEAGGEVARFLPVRRSFALRNLANLRNHRKIVVADQRRVWSGGRNLGEAYLGPKTDESRFRDLGFLLEGPAAAAFAGIIRSDWYFTTGRRVPLHKAGDIPQAGEVLAQPMPSGPDVEGDGFFEVVSSMIYGAKERLWISTPYFIPGETLGHALSLAARRGVDVRVMVPETSDHLLCDLARGPYMRDLDKDGARFLRYQAEMLHAKAILVDDEIAVVGSCNFDQRSFFLNFELSTFFYSKPEVAALAKWFEASFERCAAGPKKVSYLTETLQGVTRVFSPLL